jgi:hypothetical protein
VRAALHDTPHPVPTTGKTETPACAALLLGRLPGGQPWGDGPPSRTPPWPAPVHPFNGCSTPLFNKCSIEQR